MPGHCKVRSTKTQISSPGCFTADCLGTISKRKMKLLLQLKEGKVQIGTQPFWAHQLVCHPFAHSTVPFPSPQLYESRRVSPSLYPSRNTMTYREGRLGKHRVLLSQNNTCLLQGILCLQPPRWTRGHSDDGYMSMASGSHSSFFFHLNLLYFLLFNAPWFNVLMDFFFF